MPRQVRGIFLSGQILQTLKIKTVGAGLLAKAVYLSKNLSPDTPSSRASPLPQGLSVHPESELPQRIGAYWISSGLTITQFLSAVTGNPSLACAAACLAIMPFNCVMYLSLRLIHK